MKMSRISTYSISTCWTKNYICAKHIIMYITWKKTGTKEKYGLTAGASQPQPTLPPPLRQPIGHRAPYLAARRVRARPSLGRSHNEPTRRRCSWRWTHAASGRCRLLVMSCADRAMKGVDREIYQRLDKSVGVRNWNGESIIANGGGLFCC